MWTHSPVASPAVSADPGHTVRSPMLCIPRTVGRPLVALATVVAAACALAGPAGASQLIDRDATQVRLGVHGAQALVEYRSRGKQRHVLAWGATNALIPTGDAATRPQVEFKLDYSGGWGTYHKDVWKTFRNQCRPYDGPKLDWLVSGCKAADGSYWALQAWQIELPNLGFVPWTAKQGSRHLQLSHWSGPLAMLDVHTGWSYSGRFHDLFGRLTYRGKPVHGYQTTKYGAPLDGYGRNLYLDTFDSAYGSGWRRENGFVAHKPMGNFCYGFYGFDPLAGGYAHPPGYNAGPRPQGNGAKYRLSVQGPGVTPDVMWQGDGLPNYDKNDPVLVALEQEMNALSDQFSAGDKLCHQH
jgi:hypothetical protein